MDGTVQLKKCLAMTERSAVFGQESNVGKDSHWIGESNDANTNLGPVPADGNRRLTGWITPDDLAVLAPARNVGMGAYGSDMLEPTRVMHPSADVGGHRPPKADDRRQARIHSL